jgi:xylan 1,4-beta-xylosidase
VRFLPFAASVIALSLAAAAEPVAVTVDLSRPQGPFPQTTNWFGYDEANYTTTANGRALLKDLQAAYRAPVHVRAHHLFTSGDGTASFKWSSTGIVKLGPDGQLGFDFTIVDQIFDAWHAAGVTPMVELGFMPKEFSTHPEPYRIEFGSADMLTSGAQFPPKDYAQWGLLVRAFVDHLKQRYGEKEVSGWCFEVWNEPDIPYWHGSGDAYFKLYDYAVAGVRAALPGAKVGGPATTSPRNEHAAAYLQAFLDHVAKDKSAADGKAVPLDFISFHAKGQPEIVDGHVRMGLGKEVADFRAGFHIIAASPFAKLPIVISEADPEGCAACSAPANAYRNTPLYPAYTAAAHKAMLDLAAREKVNLQGMLSWSFEFENAGIFAGQRALATEGIGKPVLGFFRMAAQMDGRRVAATSTAEPAADAIIADGVRGAPEVGVLAAKTDHRATVMLWNYHDDETAAAPSAVNVTVAGVPRKKIRVSEFRIDGAHSNAYALWQAMGSPQRPTAAQLAQLREAGGKLDLAEPAHDVAVTGGSVELPVSLPRQSVSLFVLDW